MGVFREALVLRARVLDRCLLCSRDTLTWTSRAQQSY